jgi:hypothetical protein
MLKNSIGSGKIGCLIWLLILWGGLFVGYKFGTAQWAYLSMKEDVQEIARGAAASPRSLNVEAIQNEVIRRGEILGISIVAEDITVEDRENDLTISVYWEVEFKFPFYTYYKDYSITTTKRKGL